MLDLREAFLQEIYHAIAPEAISLLSRFTLSMKLQKFYVPLVRVLLDLEWLNSFRRRAALYGAPAACSKSIEVLSVVQVYTRVHETSTPREPPTPTYRQAPMSPTQLQTVQNLLLSEQSIIANENMVDDPAQRLDDLLVALNARCAGLLDVTDKSEAHSWRTSKHPRLQETRARPDKRSLIQQCYLL